MATVDWAALRANAEAPNNDPVPPGVYTARVDNVDIKTTSTQKMMYAITFIVTSGPQANRKVWHNMVVSPESPKALGFMFRDFDTLGLDEAFFATNPDGPTVAQALMGKECVITVRLQKNDPSRNEIARLAKPNEGGAAPAPGGVPAPSFGATAPAAPPAAAAPAPAPGAPPQRPF